MQELNSVALDILRLSIWLLLLLMIFVPLERFFAVTPRRIFPQGPAAGHRSLLPE